MSSVIPASRMTIGYVAPTDVQDSRDQPATFGDDGTAWVDRDARRARVAWQLIELRRNRRGEERRRRHRRRVRRVRDGKPPAKVERVEVRQRRTLQIQEAQADS